MTAPRGWPRTVASEIRSERDQWAQRLAACGASAEEITAASDSWDRLDDDWTAERRHYLATAAGDDEIRALIRDARADYETGTVTEEDAAERAEATSYAVAVDEASRRIGGTIPSILAWVGDDPVRARATLKLETSSRGAGRVTLISALEGLTDGS